MSTIEQGAAQIHIQSKGTEAVVPESLTVADVAQALKCSPWTVRRMISRGQLKAKRYGTMIRIDPKDLAAAGQEIQP